MRQFVLVLLFPFCFAAQVAAHPHIFIEAGVAISLSQDSIDKITVSYAFDYMFSADLIQQFDKDKSGHFDNQEIENIRQNAFINLSKQNYFIHIIDGERELNIKAANSFKATITADGIVKYSFVVSPKVSTTFKFLKVATYDDTYYMDVQLLEENITFENQGNSNYLWELIEDDEIVFYYDQIHPTCLTLFFN